MMPSHLIMAATRLGLRLKQYFGLPSVINSESDMHTLPVGNYPRVQGAIHRVLIYAVGTSTWTFRLKISISILTLLLEFGGS